MSFLDGLLGIRQVLNRGLALISRAAIDFDGDLLAEDDPVNARTRVTLNAQASTLTSATSINVGASPGLVVRVEAGEETEIEAFGTAPAGLVRFLTFDDAVTLVHSSALQLPGAVDTDVEAHDTVVAISEGSGNWRVLRLLAEAGATPDHGALTGLADDDHTQYSRVNGARAFTAAVGGITPTDAAHLATKGYVDTADSTHAGLPHPHAGTLSQLNAAVSDADVVALAGQLGNTAASPDVRGMRETGGPTLLTFGAIADGQFLARSGSTVIGAAIQALTAALSLTGSIDATIAATTDNWAPTGLSGAAVIRITLSSGSQTLTGITGGSAGRVLVLHNLSTASSLTLQGSSGTSSAANRFAPLTDRVMGPGTSAILMYDGTSSLWRVVAVTFLARGDVSESSSGLRVDSASAAFALSAVSSPSQITSNQNDYALSSSVARARISSDAARTITGIASGGAGRLLALHNIGSFPITLATESASSTAANRFALPADLVIPAGGSASLLYDSTSSRWRAASSAALVDFQTLSAATSTVTYDVLRGRNAVVTLSSGVSSTFTLNFTNLQPGMRGTLRVITTGTVNITQIQQAGVNDALVPSGDAGALLSDNDVAILEWFFDGELTVWRDATALINIGA